AWPDMQRLARPAGRLGRTRGDDKFLVVVRQRCLEGAAEAATYQRLAYRRACPVRTEQQIEWLLRCRRATELQPQHASLRIHVQAARLEVQFDARVCGCRVEEQRIEPLAADRPDHLARSRAVGQEAARTALIVQQSPAHRDELAPDVRGQVRGL